MPKPSQVPNKSTGLYIIDNNRYFFRNHRPARVSMQAGSAFQDYIAIARASYRASGHCCMISIASLLKGLTLLLSLNRLLLSLRRFLECHLTLMRQRRLAMARRTSGEQKQYKMDTTMPCKYIDIEIRPNYLWQSGQKQKMAIDFC